MGLVLIKFLWQDGELIQLLKSSRYYRLAPRDVLITRGSNRQNGYRVGANETNVCPGQKNKRSPCKSMPILAGEGS